MRNPKLIKFANVLVNYSLKIKKDELFLIEGTQSSIPLQKEIFLLTLEKGAHPYLILQNEETQEIFLSTASDEQLAYVNPITWEALRKADARLTIWGGENTRHLAGIDPDRISLRQQKQKELIDMAFKRMDSGEMRWCGTAYPTQSLAQEAGMSLSDYEDFVFSACHLNEDNPVFFWESIREKQARITEKLNLASTIRIVSEGTDITAVTAGRRWENCAGTENFPDGEVFTGPVENSLEGEIRFSFPGIYMDQEIEDIRLKFSKGKVVTATAGKGEKLLHSLLEIDAGAQRVGELAIGTNYEIQEFTRNMLFDEKIGGTVHLALGRGFEKQTGSKNTSSIHWDMLCDMRQGGEIYADGKLIYKNGNFTEDFLE